MVFTSEQLFYILLTMPMGFLAGFLVVKSNHLMVVVTGKLWSSGNARKRYTIIGALSAFVFLLFLILVTTSFDYLFMMTAGMVFAGLFTSGIIFAEKRFGQRNDILKKIIIAMYYRSDSDNLTIDDAYQISLGMIENMPKSSREAFGLLLFFFDSIFAVFVVSLALGRKFRMKRFVNLSKDEQMSYLALWENAPGLFYVMKALKSITAFSYFTSKFSWEEIEYGGMMLKRSYLA